jgi:RNA polymerase primary sigma factor
VGLEELTREREAVLARRAVAGDRRARDELVDGCLPPIRAMARHYRGSVMISRDELVQAGVLGLLRGLARYDPVRGTPFWAYAAWWVRQAMQHMVAELAYPVVLSDRALRELATVHRAAQAHRRASGGEASPAQLAAACNLSREHVLQLLAVDRPPGPIANALSDVDDFERVERQLTSSQLSGLPGALGEREREVLRAHFGLGRPSSTLQQIAVTLGISGERVRQIEARALEKVRDVALAQWLTPERPRNGTARAIPARSVAHARH